jgi:hypothetical protein
MPSSPDPSELTVCNVEWMQRNERRVIHLNLSKTKGTRNVVLGDHPKAAIGYHFKTGHRETA